MTGPHTIADPRIAGGVVTARAVVERDGTTGKVTVSNGAGDIPDGIAADAAAADGDELSVITFGEAEVVAAGAININTDVQSNGDGKVKAVTTGGYVIGRLKEAATADGHKVRIFVNIVPVAHA